MSFNCSITYPVTLQKIYKIDCILAWPDFVLGGFCSAFRVPCRSFGGFFLNEMWEEAASVLATVTSALVLAEQDFGCWGASDPGFKSLSQSHGLHACFWSLFSLEPTLGVAVHPHLPRGGPEGVARASQARFSGLLVSVTVEDRADGPPAGRTPRLPPTALPRAGPLLSPPPFSSPHSPGDLCQPRDLDKNNIATLRCVPPQVCLFFARPLASDSSIHLATPV